jgi:hypothetical protein
MEERTLALSKIMRMDAIAWRNDSVHVRFGPSRNPPDSPSSRSKTTLGKPDSSKDVSASHQMSLRVAQMQLLEDLLYLGRETLRLRAHQQEDAP